jgi:orotate phosphoribosyltransferase
MDNVMAANVFDLLSVRRGHFRYESGYHGELWLDLDRLFFEPRRLTPLVRELAAKLKRHEVEACVGPIAGGAFLAQTIAAELGTEFAYAEPGPSASDEALFSVAYRLPATVARLLRGKRVAIVDDVVNAGSAVRGTLSALVGAGAKPAVAGALLALGDAARQFLVENGLKLESLAALDNPLWEPENCPLCARGAPLDAVLL